MTRFAPDTMLRSERVFGLGRVCNDVVNLLVYKGLRALVGAHCLHSF